MAREAAALRARVQQDEAALREQIAVYQSTVDLLRDPTTRVVTLHGLGPSPEATGRIIWHPVSGGHVFVANLRAAPAGSALELWTIGDGAPQPAGLFQVDASGRGTHRIAAVEGGKPVKVFAVTLEPESGVPAPTGPMVLALEVVAPGERPNALGAAPRAGPRRSSSSRRSHRARPCATHLVEGKARTSMNSVGSAGRAHRAKPFG